MLLQRRQVLLALSGLAAPVLTVAAPFPGVYWIISNDSGPFHDAALAALKSALLDAGKPAAQLLTMSMADLAASTSNGGTPLPPPALIITLGAAAHRQLLARTALDVRLQQTPLVAALLPRVSLSAATPAPGQPFTAVLLDQPVDRLVDLVQQAFPARRRLGVLFGPSSQALRPALLRATNQRGLALVEASVPAGSAPGDIHEPLQRVLDEADVLLALPDGLVFTGDSLRNILISSYRRRVPMVSYAQSHVRAGATAALYVTPEQTAQQLASLLGSDALARREWPRPVDAAGFEVAINEPVARSLGLALADASKLAEAVRLGQGPR